LNSFGIVTPFEDLGALLAKHREIVSVETKDIRFIFHADCYAPFVQDLPLCDYGVS